MALGVTTDTNILSTLKPWFKEKIESALFRNSPVLKYIKKEKVGGKTVNFNVLYGHGGAVSGDYTVARAAAATVARNVEWAVPPGRVFSVWIYSQAEVMASETKEGAYERVITDKAFAGTESARKALAACLYGYGRGEFCTQPGGTAGATTIVLPTDGIIKIDIGTQFVVTTTAVPGSALYGGGPHTVTAIDGTTVTFTPAIPGGDWAAGTLMEYYGGRDGSANPNMPAGLPALVPFLADRTGGTWTTYIGTALYGVTRSTNPEALAGSYVKRDKVGSETYTSTVTRAVEKVRNRGAQPNMIILNPDDFRQVMTETRTNTNFWQAINAKPQNTSENNVVNGISSFRWSFSSTWVEYIYDDPYCPLSYGWVLDMEELFLIGLSNVKKPLDDGITNNDPGKQDVSGVDVPDMNQFQFTVDEYLTSTPATAASTGPATEVALSMYCNFMHKNPANACAIWFNP